MKVSRMIAVAGFAAAMAAGSVFAGPTMTSKGVKAQAMNPVKRDPISVRGVKYVNGKIVGTTPWKAYKAGNGQVTDAPAYAFDAFSDDASGLPGGAPLGNRYILLWTAGGPVDYVSPVRLSDMTMASGFNGAQSQFADILFYAGDASNPNQNVDFFYALFTAEDKFTNACEFDGTTYDGIQLGFGPGDGFFFSNIDLTNDPTLFWQLPNDGEGSYVVLLTQDAGGTILAAGQTGLWCTGEDQTPPTARAGTNEEQEGTDESSAPDCGATSKATNIPDGVVDLACECFDFTFNVPEGSVLTSSVAFGAEGGVACYPDCDGNATLNIDDFICFQTFFAIGDPYADCDGTGTLNIDDFICFQTFYAIGC